MRDRSRDNLPHASAAHLQRARAPRGESAHDLSRETARARAGSASAPGPGRSRRGRAPRVPPTRASARGRSTTRTPSATGARCAVAAARSARGRRYAKPGADSRSHARRSASWRAGSDAHGPTVRRSSVSRIWRTPARAPISWPPAAVVGTRCTASARAGGTRQEYPRGRPGGKRDGRRYGRKVLQIAMPSTCCATVFAVTRQR